MTRKIAKKNKAAARRGRQAGRFRVARSRTGLGLFAMAPIRRGQFIVEYWGKRVRWADANLRNKYLFHLNREWAIDGSDRRNLARYINHSCKPNAVAYTVQGAIRIYARKRIEPGDEIAYDYGREYYDLILKPIGCKCPACAATPKRRRTVAKRAIFHP